MLSITDASVHQPLHRFPIDAMALREAKASLPIAAGEQTMSINVTISWAIDNRKIAPVHAEVHADN